MVVINRTLILSSNERRQLIDITREVEDFVAKSGVKNGMCTISAPHATAAIVANENERGLIKDIIGKVEDLFPASANYYHNAIDDNADAHLASSFLGHSRSFPIMNGRIVRGTWQNVFLLELDGPRSSRKVHIQAMGET
jgi:secondary thiamine-phosphate synthase enzyme